MFLLKANARDIYLHIILFCLLIVSCQGFFEL